MLIDTHIHLDRISPEFDLGVELAEADAAGIKNFLVPGVDRRGWQRLDDVVSATEGAWAAFGLHPMAAAEWNRECGEELYRLLRDREAVAVGEIGLDRYLEVPVAVQEKAFREQISIAVELALPILIHCRKMPGRLLEILAEENAQQVGGIMHAFAGSWQTAKAAMDLGFLLSFGGTLTYPEARRALEVLQQAPDDVIVIETDAPDLAPYPHRGEPNRPVWLKLVLAKLAEVKGWSVERAAEITAANARRVLNIKDINHNGNESSL